MYVYDIYEHPRYGAEAVRRGFSWSAFLVPSVWAVNRGLGMTTLLLVAATSLVFDVAKIVGAWLEHPLLTISLSLVLIGLVGLRPGMFGYRWHAEALKRAGYTRRDTVAASNRCAALRAWSRHSYLPLPVHLAAG
jgi:hypothetical protein